MEPADLKVMDASFDTLAPQDTGGREVAALVKLLATANRCQSRAGKLRSQCLMSEFEEVKPGFPVELGLISLASCS